jgi:hypothetical protein
VSTNDELWDTYAGALISCEIDGRVVRLRAPEVDPLPADPLFVLTAWNPGGVDRDVATNDDAERALEQELASAGTTSWPALGRSPDDSWSEPGVAVTGPDRAAACALGKRYGQLAVYELTEELVRVVRCADRAVVRERPRAERPHSNRRRNRGPRP